MPKLGFSMERGTVVQWLKGAGDRVEQGEPVVLVHSEKIEYEVEAQGSGKLARILAEAGVECDPGHLLGVIAEDGEDVESFLLSYQPAAIAEEESSGEVAAATASAGDRAQREHSEVPASPRARRLAAEKRVDLRSVASSHPGKRISEDDVFRFLQRHESVESAGPAVLRRVPLAGLRGEIANRMLTSWQSAAMVALSMPVDFSSAERLRESLSGVSYQDIVMRATALALRADPQLNSAVREGAIEIYEAVNIGFAVSLDAGLIVPVIHNVDRKSLGEISQERAALVEAAQHGSLTWEQVTGGTFTISSLGSYGVTAFTPILNPPQSGILGIGAVELVPAVVEGAVAVQRRMTLTLVFDHRVVDGAPAAALLKQVRERLERPGFD